MYRQPRNSIRFGSPIEAPAKAGVWGWVKPACAAKGGERRGADFSSMVKIVGTCKYMTTSAKIGNLSDFGLFRHCKF